MEFEVTGTIVDEQGKGIPKVKISVAEQDFLTNNEGTYSIKLANRPHFAFKLSKDGFYSIIHTFSKHELNNFANSSSRQVPPISLVNKIKGRTLFALGGDVMMGRRYWSPHFDDAKLIQANSVEQDTKAILQHMRPYMSLADLAVINLETQIADEEPKTKAAKSVTFITPPESLDALIWAGIDYVSLGNNHTFDYLDNGLTSTLKELNKRKLGFSGAGLNEKVALAPFVADLNGSQFAMLGYVGWSGSALPSQTAEKDKGGAALGSMNNIKSSVGESLTKGLLPIVQYHGSLEYSDEPTLVTEQRLKAAIDEGAVLALAHHPHVAQGFEIYNQKLIAYSMGNFAFDQYFYSTHHSYMLYVWMDSESFHRAEIIPIYVKGYKPTPATDINRYSTLKRLSELSKLRSTQLTSSGGHGIITPLPRIPDSKTKQISKSVSESKLAHLYDLPWQYQISRIDVPDDISYRLGVVLSNGGDFENHASFNANERGRLITSDNHKILASPDNSWLSLNLSDEPAWFGMQYFRRVYNADSPSSVSFKVNSNKPASINVYWQGRKTRDKLFDALNSGQKHLIGTFEYQPNGWQEVVFDFNSPRIGYRSYRVLLEINGEEQQLELDDFALIEWQTAYTQSPTPPRLSTLAKQASYIGFNKEMTGKIQLNLSH